MKISVKKDTHIGEQPIRVLKHNLTTRLVERNEGLIEKLQSDLRLNKNIRYHITSRSLFERQTPYVEENGTINLHESYLSYVWIICYYFFVLHEEGFAIPECIKRGEPTPKPHNPELIKDAEKLFAYAKSLIRGYTLWDLEELPNPEYYDPQSPEGYYVERSNDLFVEVVNFILYHEIAHAELEHIKQINDHQLSNNEVKELELEADSRAIELVLESCRNARMSELAIIIGLASMIFFRDNLNGGSKHPDLDVRLQNAIKLINPPEDNSIWIILALFLKIWDKQFNIGLRESRTEFDTYKEVFYDLLNQINK